MKKCQECGTKTNRKKWCSRKCWQTNYNRENRDAINKMNRDRLKRQPEKERARRAEAARKWRATHPEGARKFQRNKNNIRMPKDPNEIIFYGYKPPFRKFKGGFGYEGVLQYSKIDQKVQCHFCGFLFRALNNGHLKKVHNMTAREYKEKVGLSQSSALMGEETRKKILERGHNPNHMKELKKAQKNRRERLRKGLPDLQSGFKLSLEKKNERGTCPDQLLDRIKDAAKKLKRTPTLEEFLSLNEGKFWGSIRNTYGSWTNAVRKLGMDTYKKEYTREQLLETMRTFYKVHKRTPKWSDMERGILPSANAFYAKFKSLNDARLQAGVPLVIALGKRREEWVPTEKQREQMLTKQD